MDRPEDDARSGPVRVAVVGAGGRLGRYACGLVEAADDLALVARLGRADELAAGLAAARAQVALDVTVAGRGAAHARLMLAAGVRPVVGTSGVSAAETAELDALARARGLGGLVVPNFSVGAWLVARLAVAAARELDALGTCRLEILEEHRAEKRDAPSSTALETARLVAEALGTDPAAIPVHSVRLPGIVANQEVVFGAAGEVLRLRHETTGLEAWGPGILACLRHAAHARGVARGLDAVLAATRRE